MERQRNKAKATKDHNLSTCMQEGRKSLNTTVDSIARPTDLGSLCHVILKQSEERASFCDLETVGSAGYPQILFSTKYVCLSKIKQAS